MSYMELGVLALPGDGVYFLSTLVANRSVPLAVDRLVQWGWDRLRVPRLIRHSIVRYGISLES